MMAIVIVQGNVGRPSTDNQPSPVYATVFPTGRCLTSTVQQAEATCQNW